MPNCEPNHACMVILTNSEEYSCTFTDLSMNKSHDTINRHAWCDKRLTLNASSIAPGWPCLPSGLLHIPKMVPTETAQSILELPSSGSNTTTYSPLLASGIMMGSSRSSLTCTCKEQNGSRPLLQWGMYMRCISRQDFGHCWINCSARRIKKYTKTAHCPHLVSTLTKTLSARMSSFFWSSPCSRTPSCCASLAMVGLERDYSSRQ